ncbi:MAG: hypothetical protein GF388_02180 [Candidatus Aegiribacteria sp.]|nr:hypothetical protein [Candidatus Aegiribacteria sp.]MBD3294132.1 hypothetical protein [Candidatus Fermentibacteria bacterium]
MLYSEAQDFIFGRRRMGMKFGLERVRRLFREAGDPQKDYRTIHVVGTNGKGSTTAFLADILENLGFRVGRMTSPHLLHYRERIAVNGKWIPEMEVVRYLETFMETIEECSATFFEITTAMSAWHFRNCGVDVVVAEAGLGGRLDATRLMKGELTIFTGVEVEHRRILGTTEPLIATEKVAIAAYGTGLIAYRQTPDVEKVIDERVEKMKLRRLIPEPASRAPLPGEHQRRNAGLALAAAGYFADGEEELKKAYEKTCSEFKWPGRIDLRRGSPDILFDVAHNPGSMGHLIDHLQGIHSLPVPAVAGFLADKFWREMTLQLKGVFHPVVATTPLNERCLDAEELAEEFETQGTSASAEESIPAAVETGRGLALQSGLLVVTGSFFVVGEAMMHCWRKGWIELPDAGQENTQLFETAGGC